MFESVLRKLARDQWVRLHGTPRVTVLVGGAPGREVWEQWAALSGLAGALLEGGDFDERVREAVGRAVAAPTQPIAVQVSAEAAAVWRAGRCDRLAAMVDEGWIEVSEDSSAAGGAFARKAGTGAREPGAREPGAKEPGAKEPGAKEPGAKEPGAKEPGARELGADPGARELGARQHDLQGGRRSTHVDARSVAEATLFEALEATPATAGRFALNESLAVRFGALAAEVDLLSRGDRIAIEIDGFHHFADLDGYRRDRKKDLLLQSQGLFVVRLLADDVMRDVRAAVNVVVQALAYRLKERG